MNIRFFDLHNSRDFEELSQKKIYIYGAGEFGRDVCAYFERYGLTVQKYIVDDMYYKINMSDNIISMSMLEYDEGIKVVVLGIASPKKLTGPVSINSAK